MRGAMQVLLPLVLLALFSACTTTPVLEGQPSAEFGSADLYPVTASGFAEAFARRDANLSSYAAVDIQPLSVDGIEVTNTLVSATLRRDWQMTPERTKALQENWARAMDRAFANYGRAGSGGKVLKITAALTRVAPGRPTATTIGGALQPAGSSQDAIEISGEFRLYDASNDRLLAVIRDVRTITSVSMSRTGPVAVTSLFNSWSALLHTRIAGR